MVDLRKKRSREEARKCLIVFGHPCNFWASKGVIKHSDFQDCAEEGFVDEFDDVINAGRKGPNPLSLPPNMT